MNLIILDSNFATLGVISVFNTLIWDRRYYSVGVFELHTPAEFFELMNDGMYLYRNDRTELGVIREVNFSRDEKGARNAYCKGYFSESLLNNRAIGLSYINFYKALKRCANFIICSFCLSYINFYKALKLVYVEVLN